VRYARQRPRSPGLAGRRRSRATRRGWSGAPRRPSRGVPGLSAGASGPARSTSWASVTATTPPIAFECRPRRSQEECDQPRQAVDRRRSTPLRVPGGTPAWPPDWCPRGHEGTDRARNATRGHADNQPVQDTRQAWTEAVLAGYRRPIRLMTPIRRGTQPTTALHRQVVRCTRRRHKVRPLPCRSHQC